jgi:hypothetical protein
MAQFFTLGYQPANPCPKGCALFLRIEDFLFYVPVASLLLDSLHGFNGFCEYVHGSSGSLSSIGSRSAQPSSKLKNQIAAARATAIQMMVSSTVF